MRVKFAYAVPAPAAVEMLTACSKKSDGEAGTDEKVAADHAAPLMGRIAYAGKHNENGAQLAVEQITTEGRANGLQRNEASDTQATITTINSVQPDVSKPGGMDTTGGPRPKQAATFGIRAKILGGDGVCTDKVGELAGTAVQNLVCSEAGLALSKMDKGADFEQKYQARFKVPVQSDAPYTYDAVYVIVDAMKRANSVDAPKVLTAIATTDYNGLTGHIAFDDKGDLKGSAITLVGFKDNKKNVIDVVTP